MGEKLKKALAEYGRLAIGVYIALFLVVFVGAAVGIHLGFSFEGVSGSAGTLAAAWMATKLAQPIRILATVAITPVLAGVLNRFSRRPPEVTAPEPENQGNL